ncbi:hypothetical protein AQUCO_00500344v1 [Aquilegia coerulea]|uniref:Late embryogenesis abundant protein LEA-2 subgroup domain-containing protein n=1 Tax=Aquilegia coerulea TaxID=218851 RepID=A0A2G5ERJ4_AQUCA|nr:hypothetical protein AQUCO_00500344v1 [Aquilegia coerulea]
MLSLLPPPPQKQIIPPPPSNQMIMSKHTINQHFSTPLNRPSTPGKQRYSRLLPPPRRTNPLIWCVAFCCIIFSLLLILSGIAILIIFLVIKPKYPLFEATSASLNSIYLDSAQYLNGDFTFIANFSNPSRKMDIRFEYLDIELYFFDRLIGTQALQPFNLKRRGSRVEFVHMISSQVYLPLNHSIALQKQVQTNRVRYFLKGTFRVRAIVGLTHFSYWIYGRCQVVMTSPPNGVLVAHSCRTKR